MSTTTKRAKNATVDFKVKKSISVVKMNQACRTDGVSFIILAGNSSLGNTHK